MLAVSAISMGVVAQLQQVVVPAQQRVDRVAGLVHQRLHVAVQADAVGEDERHAFVLELVLVAARRLALAAHQVEQPAAAQRQQPVGELRFDRVQQAAAQFDQFVLAGERPQRRAPFGVDLEVPRAQLRDAQALGAVGIEAAHRRHHVLGDGVVQLAARLRVVVVAAEILEAERRVGREPGVAADLRAQRDQAIEQRFGLGPDRSPRRQCCPVGGFALGAVLALEERRDLLQRQRLAAELDRDPGDQGLLLGLQVGFFALQFGVLGAEQGDLRAALAEHDVVHRAQLGQRRRGEQPTIQFVGAHLHARHHLVLHRQVGGLRRGVVGSARHRHVAVSLLGCDPCLQFALVAQPSPQVVGIVQAAVEQVVEQGLELGRRAGVEAGWREVPSRRWEGLCGGTHGADWPRAGPGAAGR